MDDHCNKSCPNYSQFGHDRTNPGPPNEVFGPGRIGGSFGLVNSNFVWSKIISDCSGIQHLMQEISPMVEP